MSKQVEVIEVGPRDGFQSVKCTPITTEQKLTVIDQLVAAGVKHIEYTSFVSPKAIPQLADAADVTRVVLEKYPDMDLFALIPNLRGAQNAYELGLRRVCYVVSLSKSHNKANINRTHEQSLEAYKEIRAAYPDLDIIVEIHSLLDANTAAILGKALEPYRIMYYEEPTMPCNPGVFKHIKERCSLPLATGERGYTRWGFRQFFEDRTLDVIQPDLCNTGGITETKKICDMAQVYDVGVQIHVCGGPIATAAALQVEAVIPNFVIREEHNANLLKVFKNSGKYYYAPVNGSYDIPELPGIGQEMSEDYMATAKKAVIK